MSWLKEHPLPPRATSHDSGKNDETADTRSIYSDEQASNGGHGTDDTLAVTRILEEHDIPCCLVGIAALVFYGAGRVRDDWEICVPKDLVNKAAELLQSEPYATQYRRVKPWPYIQPNSLIHTLRGLPYPKLSVLIQSYLDTYSMLELCDIIDGTNISEEWGEENLELEGTNDVQWAKEMNEKGRRLSGKPIPCAREGRKIKREMWQSLVRSKEDRLDWTKPKDVFLTQYRVIGAPDPWTEISERS